MKALTIKQPWVHAILREGKNIENRSWKTKHRGWIAIHSAATPRRYAAFPRGVKMPDLDDLDYSAIVAIAQLVDIKDSIRSKWFYKPPRGETNYGWVLGKVKKLKKPIVCKGSLGLWNVPAKIQREIARQLPSLDLDPV